MSDSLLEKLRHLDATLLDMRKQFDAQDGDLKALQSKPYADKRYAELKSQLAKAEEKQRNYRKDNEKLKQRSDQLDEKYQTLLDVHQDLKNQHAKLVEKCELLAQDNHKLLEKNRKANEHTKVVIERLISIDQTPY